MRRAAAFRVVDLFAGIGGFTLAARSLGGDSVLAVEAHPVAAHVYARNFGATPPTDIADVHDLPPHEILCGGFPCQSFSQAGRKGGLDDPRGSLYQHVVRLLRVAKPSGFVLENVVGLLNHDNGATIARVVGDLADAGYSVAKTIVDAGRWVPQSRKRVYIVGVRRDIDAWAPDLGRLGFDAPKPPRVWEILDAHADVDPKYVLTERMWQVAQAHRDRHRAKGHGFGFWFLPKTATHSRTLTRHYYRDGFEILLDRGALGRPRKLTPDECRRLMGFPADYDFAGVSDTARYQLLGNAVVPQATAAVMERLVRVIARRRGDRK